MWNYFYVCNIVFEGTLRGTNVYLFNISFNVTIGKSTTVYYCCIAMTTMHTHIHACRNITTQWRRATQFFRKIYLSLYLKGFERVTKGFTVWEESWRVGDWTELQHIDPHSYGHNSVYFPFSWAAQPKGLGAQPLWDMVLIPASSLQLTRTSCAASYIIVLHLLNSTCRQWRLSLWYLRPDAPVIYTGAFSILTVRPGSICNTSILYKIHSNRHFALR